MVRVVTNSSMPMTPNMPTPLYRLSLYEFRGEPPEAYFVEDLGCGCMFISDIMRLGKQKAKELGALFVPNVGLMDSIEKVYKTALKI